MIDAPRLLEKFNGQNGATDSAIDQVEQRLGLKFPAEYAEFLKITNGGEGFIGESYAILYPVEELASANEDYNAPEFAPGLLIFGSDGGGEAFGLDTRTPDSPIVMVSLVGLDWKEAKPLGAVFSEFLQRLYDGNLF